MHWLYLHEFSESLPHRKVLGQLGVFMCIFKLPLQDGEFSQWLHWFDFSHTVLWSCLVPRHMFLCTFFAVTFVLLCWCNNPHPGWGPIRQPGIFMCILRWALQNGVFLHWLQLLDFSPLWCDHVTLPCAFSLLPHLGWGSGDAQLGRDRRAFSRGNRAPFEMLIPPGDNVWITWQLIALFSN